MQALIDPNDHGHLVGDVFAPLLVAPALGVLTPRGVVAQGEQAAAA